MALNSQANEIDSVRLHLLDAQHQLANTTTTVGLAVDEWDEMLPKQRERFRGYWLDSLDRIAAEIATAQNIIRATGGRR